MAAGFIALRNDYVGAFARMTKRMLYRARERHHLDASVVRERHDLSRVAKTNDEDRHILFQNDFQLFARGGRRFHPALAVRRLRFQAQLWNEFVSKLGVLGKF